MEANVTTIVAQSEPNFVTSIGIAIGIFLIGLIIGRILSRLTHALLEFIGLEDMFGGRGKRGFSIHTLISESVAIIVYIIFFIIALDYLGVSTIVLTIFGAIAILVVLISVLLSLRDSLPNMIAYTKIKRKMKPGDTVSVDSVTGTVQYLSMFEVEVLTKQNEIIHVPNRLFMNAKYSVKKAKQKTTSRS